MRGLVIGLTVLLAPFMVPAVANAHVLKESNGISTVLHIPPDDNPQAGEETELDFSFGDDRNAFSLPDCDCFVSIKGEKLVQKTMPRPPVAGATLDGIVTVNFPHGGAFGVIVEGRSKSGVFSTFRTRYVVRVANQDRQTGGQAATVFTVSAGSLAILALVAFNNIREGGRYGDRPKITRKT